MKKLETAYINILYIYIEEEVWYKTKRSKVLSVNQSKQTLVRRRSLRKILDIFLIYNPNNHHLSSTKKVRIFDIYLSQYKQMHSWIKKKVGEKQQHEHDIV